MVMERGKTEQLTKRDEFQVSWQLLNRPILWLPDGFTSDIVIRRDKLGQEEKGVYTRWTKSSPVM